MEFVVLWGTKNDGWLEAREVKKEMSMEVRMRLVGQREEMIVIGYKQEIVIWTSNETWLVHVILFWYISLSHRARER